MRNPIQTLTDLARTALAGDDPAAVCNVLYIATPEGHWAIEVAAGTPDKGGVRYCLWLDPNDQSKGCVSFATLPAAEKAMQLALMRHGSTPPAPEPVAESVATINVPTGKYFDAPKDPAATLAADELKPPVEGE